VFSLDDGQRDNCHRPKRFLIGQLGSYGDCLYATTLAYQIKTDYPDCHLTWGIGSIYRSILENNPFIDEIWEVPLSTRADLLTRWQQFEDEALERQKRGDFDEIFLTQVFPNNLRNFDGTLRSSLFRAYNRPITVSVTPVLRLSPSEIENVRLFAESHHIFGKKHVILFECSPKSDQSFVTQKFAIAASKALIAKIPDIYIIISSNEALSTDHKQIIDGSKLSFRENAELTKYCSLLVGCSSGISWLSTSDWAKSLPNIQLLKKHNNMYASFVVDHTYQGIPTDNIIEMTECSDSQLVHCIELALLDGFSVAKRYYHKQIRIHFIHYAQVIYIYLIKHRLYKEALLSLKQVKLRFRRSKDILCDCFVAVVMYELKALYNKIVNIK
jgi:ADP-heptose:LPS heptosyltransferase